MALYKFYCLDTNKQIKAAINVDCLSDEDARDQAAIILQVHEGIEIWHGGRVVGQTQRATGAS
jgi:hypothetical protein